MSRHKDREHSMGPAIVFWDFDGCLPHAGATGHGLVEALRTGLLPHCSSISTVKAFLDLSRGKQQYKKLLDELRDSAVQLVDCPRRDRRDTSDRALSVDIFATCMERLPPLTLCIVSQDASLAPFVALLRNRRYKVIILTTGGDEEDGRSTLTAQTDLVLPWHPSAATKSKLIAPLRGHEIAPVAERVSEWAAATAKAPADPPTPPPPLLQPLAKPFTPLGIGAATKTESAWVALIARKDPQLPRVEKISATTARPPLPLPAPPPSSARPQPNGIVNGASSPSPPPEPPLRTLPPRLSKAFLAQKHLLIAVALALISSCRQPQLAACPLLLVSRRLRDIIEPVAYRFVRIDSIPQLLRIGRGLPARLLACVTVLEIDLPVHCDDRVSSRKLKCPQDEACVKLIELCYTMVSTLRLVRGNWSSSASTGASTPPPASLRLALSRLPKLTRLDLRASAPSADVDLPFNWLLVDTPSGQTPLPALRILRVERLVGRPMPLYGMQLPLPPFIPVPLPLTGTRWGPPPPSPTSLLPCLERFDVIEGRLAADELARLFVVAASRFDVLRLERCSVPPSVILAAVTGHLKASKPRRIEVVDPRGSEWREDKAVTLAKRLCVPLGVELVVA